MKFLSATVVASVFATGALLMNACGSGSSAQPTIAPVTTALSNCGTGQLYSNQYGALTPASQCGINGGIPVSNPNVGCVQSTSSGINNGYSGYSGYNTVNNGSCGSVAAVNGICPAGFINAGNNMCISQSGYGNGYGTTGGMFIGSGYSGVGISNGYMADPLHCPYGGRILYMTSAYTWMCG